MVHALRQSDVLLWYPLVVHAPIQFFPQDYIIYIFQINGHTV